MVCLVEGQDLWSMTARFAASEKVIVSSSIYGTVSIAFCRQGGGSLGYDRVGLY